MTEQQERAVVWLTLADAAEHIRASKDVVRAAVSAGEIPAFGIGTGRREYRLKAADVDAWLESKTWEPRK